MNWKTLLAVGAVFSIYSTPSTALEVAVVNDNAASLSQSAQISSLKSTINALASSVTTLQESIDKLDEKVTAVDGRLTIVGDTINNIDNRVTVLEGVNGINGTNGHNGSDGYGTNGNNGTDGANATNKTPKAFEEDCDTLCLTYKEVYGRLPDQDGYDYWYAEIQKNGWSVISDSFKETFLNAARGSDCSTSIAKGGRPFNCAQICDELCQEYKSVYGRVPDQAGYDYWKADMAANGWTVDSPEFKKAFKNGANNAADEAAAEAKRQAASRAAAAAARAADTAAEARKRAADARAAAKAQAAAASCDAICKAYKNNIGRLPEPSGRAYWEAEKARNGWSDATLNQAIRNGLSGYDK